LPAGLDDNGLAGLSVDGSAGLSVGARRGDGFRGDRS
jgi:hypothetical protein